jgi:hypothetical protein
VKANPKHRDSVEKKLLLTMDWDGMAYWVFSEIPLGETLFSKSSKDLLTEFILKTTSWMALFASVS